MSVNHWVKIWLFTGLFMLFMQIIIGGVTRLTGSGLSITKWEIVTGTLPPLSEKSWIEEFDKYKNTPQYQKINVGMTMREFKFIYFWEYFHRLWARAMGFVFIIPFVIFLRKGLLDRKLIRNLMVVIFLASLAAIFGWIMVASGLVNRPWVNAYKLSVHLCIGISVFAFLLWSTLHFVYPATGRIKNTLTLSLFVLLGIQLFLGGLMSGLKAALIFPTWPDIGGHIIPPQIFDKANWTTNHFIHYDSHSFVFALVHFLHRTVAYIIAVMGVFILIRRLKAVDFQRVKRQYVIFFIILLVQVVIGILTLLESVGQIPVFWGVMHQGTAVLLLASYMVFYYFFTRHHGGSSEMVNASPT